MLYRNKNECCGCEACANACPKGIIEMITDSEGFMYPSIVHPERCVNCKRCETVCPIKNAHEVANFSERSFAGFSKSQKEVKSSASGSLGTAISKGFVAQGGVVYGVKYSDDNLRAEYGKSTTVDGLEKFRTSKYIQSQKKDTFKKIETDLVSGQSVLFFGLPCDVYALKLFLAKDYDNLYTCALICHGVTSPFVQEQYIKTITSAQQCPVRKFSVRYKKEGWKPYYIHAVLDNGKEFIEKFAESSYGVAFLYFKRPSCNACPIKRKRNHADMTIGDYHIAAGGKVDPYNPDGVSSVIVHNERGMTMLSLAENFFIEEVPLKNVLYSEAYYRAIPARANRREFGEVFSKDGLEAACSLPSVKRIDFALARKAQIKTIGAKIKKVILRKR